MIWLLYRSRGFNDSDEPLAKKLLNDELHEFYAARVNCTQLCGAVEPLGRLIPSAAIGQIDISLAVIRRGIILAGIALAGTVLVLAGIVLAGIVLAGIVLAGIAPAAPAAPAAGVAGAV